ncbi:RsmB/NOP family class I SAM-dependent RNA methyltransferase [Pseudooceanicola nanhaiensis]|uniref:RsmB/NOP family class I SAM-dependent RNA methyltransferase n=1 Tax=Pseudooceanicola nanhaiensis TaxID=375761 RepID=UPI001CD43F10|nr:RsmB/NOP family class I SAM-dependent RNA methyltransferase [Pseudooceanicola nanhaiensis]MCA0920729.1 RsmB/NOP family class I SAM-dependent RNA methyltransferase [Pseudooceanicola nanhaiensis]
MTPGARIAAAAALLDEIAGGTAAEKALTGWARRSRFAGSGDRAAIRDHVFDVLRRWRSCAVLGGGTSGRARMIGLLRSEGRDPSEVFTGEGHAPAALTEAEMAPPAEMTAAEALDLPDWLLAPLQEALGGQAEAEVEMLRHRAAVFLRVNLAKSSMDQVVAELSSGGIEARPHPLCATALEVIEGARRINQSDAYRDGRVELQDVASQAVTAALPLDGVGTVLDYCAGGGGKTLAMAARHKARYIAHDAHPQRLKDLPERARRAGVAVEIAATTALKRQAPFDLVLTDVPCSGSGAWRRSPEGKWALTPEALMALNRTQDEILDAAAGLVAPDGVLAYATCSLLREENHDRVAAFLARHPEWHLTYERQFLLSEGGDGFYAAHLTRKSPAA